MTDDLRIDRSGPVATIVLNRPDQRNAITYEMWKAFPEVFRQLDNDPDVRVVLLRGEGDIAFSAGADIKDFQETRSTPEKAANYRDRVEEACGALAAMSKPTVAVVRGYCIGGAFELTLFADIRVGDTTAQISLPAAKRGLTAGHGILSRLQSIAGAGVSRYLLLSSRLIDAEHAKSAGLLAAVVPPVELGPFVEGLVAEIAETSPVSHRTHKGVFEDLLAYGVPDAVPEERRAIPRRTGTSEDFAEGVRSFIEKRKPDFPGR